MKPILTLSSRVTTTNSFSCQLTNTGDELPGGFRLAFSMLAPAQVRAGATLVRSVGGYAELRRPDDAPLATGQTWAFEIAYAIARHRPLNVSWGMEGAHVLTAAAQVLTVTTSAADFGAGPPPPPVAVAGPELELALHPTPTSWQPSGDFLPPDVRFKAGRNFAPAATSEIDGINELAKRIGRPLLSEEEKSLPLDINLSTATTTKCSYRLTINQDQIELACSNAEAVALGLLTLVQLRVTHPAGIPCGVLADQPRFGWRGMHFDCARHYYCVATIKRLLDLLALLKFNRLHWHLIDDEAFRLDLNCYPELAPQTSWRGPGQLVPAIFGGGGQRNGGYYNAAEVAEILAHARSVGITVMPEIELPAHCWALLQVLPQMRDPDDASGAVSVQGYHDNVINPAMPAFWEFLAKVIPEIAAQFGPGWIHLGGDEVPPKVWSNSPALQKFNQEHGLTDPTDVGEWTMHKAAGIVAAVGGTQQWRPAAWADAAVGRNGGIGHDALLFAWADQETGLAAARAGYDVVMCPAQKTYLDMAPDDHPTRRGMNWAALVGVADTVSWEPVPANEPDLAKRIVGVQGALWSETVRHDQAMEPLLAPRILGIAETAWAEPARKDSPATLRQKINAWRPLFSAMSWEVGTDA